MILGQITSFPIRVIRVIRGCSVAALPGFAALGLSASVCVHPWFDIRLANGGLPPIIAGMIGTKAKRSPTQSRRKDRFWTFAEMEAELPESHQPIELWDGELIMPPSPSFEHQENTLSFYDSLKAWVRQHRLGKVVAAPMDMVLSPHRAVQPDVLFISKERLGIIRRCVRGPADLVAEVVSPGSRNRDRIEKRDLYEQYGVREFWLIDPEAKTVEVFFLEHEQYRLLGRFRAGQTAESRLLPGFKIAVDDLIASEGP